MSDAAPSRPAGLEFRVVGYQDPVARAMIAEVQQEYVLRYGGPDSGPVDPEEFTAPRGLFLVGLLAGEPVATGAFRPWPAAGDEPVVELKRMYVRSSARQAGLGRAMLRELERRARQAARTRIVLETGTQQPEAIALYRSEGYHPIEPFGHYARSPEQRCFGKPLRPTPAVDDPGSGGRPAVQS